MGDRVSVRREWTQSEWRQSLEARWHRDQRRRRRWRSVQEAVINTLKLAALAALVLAAYAYCVSHGWE